MYKLTMLHEAEETVTNAIRQGTDRIIAHFDKIASKQVSDEKLRGQFEIETQE